MNHQAGASALPEPSDLPMSERTLGIEDIIGHRSGPVHVVALVSNDEAPILLGIRGPLPGDVAYAAQSWTATDERIILGGLVHIVCYRRQG